MNNIQKMHDYFFQIPIYIRDHGSHTKDLAEKKKKRRNLFLNGCPEDFRKEYVKRGSLKKNLDNWEYNNWYPWRFNEIVGYITLYRFGSQLRGDLWLVRGKITKRMAKKRFFYYGKFFEKSFHSMEKDVTQMIVETIIKYAEESESLKNRFFDFEEFKRISPFIDWNNLFK